MQLDIPEGPDASLDLLRLKRIIEKTVTMVKSAANRETRRTIRLIEWCVLPSIVGAPDVFADSIGRLSKTVAVERRESRANVDVDAPPSVVQSSTLGFWLSCCL